MRNQVAEESLTHEAALPACSWKVPQARGPTVSLSVCPLSGAEPLFCADHITGGFSLRITLNNLVVEKESLTLNTGSYFVAQAGSNSLRGLGWPCTCNPPVFQDDTGASPYVTVCVFLVFVVLVCKPKASGEGNTFLMNCALSPAGTHSLTKQLVCFCRPTDLPAPPRGGMSEGLCE